MSPSEAPESDEPYCATASFSSAISSALIETELAGLLVESDDACVDLLADREALRTLLVAVARQVGARMKEVMSLSDELHFEAAHP
jgi:hypothetical protein